MCRQTIDLFLLPPSIPLRNTRLCPDIHGPSHVLGHISINDNFLVQLPQFPLPVWIPTNLD